MQEGKKTYFISDFHLGVPNYDTSLIRERLIVKWLDEIKKDAHEIFLMGDVFDFWFEYKTAVPKGYVRLLGKLAEISDSGIKIHYFTGNHDMWVFDYFKKELNITIYRQPIFKTIQGKVFYLGHGDGLGPGDYGYKIIKKVFSNALCQWLFARLHPNFGIGLANFFSRSSRKANGPKDEIFMGKENEWLYIYSKEMLMKNPEVNYFIFGHRHLPLDLSLSDNSRYINLGEWLNYNSYAVFDGEKLELKHYQSQIK